MMIQILSDQARDTAEALVKKYGFKGAMNYIIAEMDYGAKDRQSHWLRVWRELKTLREGNHVG